MSTASYIVKGKGNILAWNSASHGAGRRMSRTQALKSVSKSQFVDSLKDVVSDTSAKLRDESEFA